MAPAPWTGRCGRGLDVSRMRHGIVPIRLATVYRTQGGEASGGCFAAGRFIELSDEHSLSSLQDQSRTREKCQPGQIAAGGWYWLAALSSLSDEPYQAGRLAGLIAPADVRTSLFPRTFPYKTALQPLGAPLSDMPRVIGTIPAGLDAADERGAGTSFYGHRGEYVAVLTTWMVRTARGRQSQPQAGWPARAALSTKGRACLVPGPGCQFLTVTL